MNAECALTRCGIRLATYPTEVARACWCACVCGRVHMFQAPCRACGTLSGPLAWRPVGGHWCCGVKDGCGCSTASRAAGCMRDAQGTLAGCLLGRGASARRPLHVSLDAVVAAWLGMAAGHRMARKEAASLRAVRARLADSLLTREVSSLVRPYHAFTSRLRRRAASHAARRLRTMALSRLARQLQSLVAAAPLFVEIRGRERVRRRLPSTWSRPRTRSS